MDPDPTEVARSQRRQRYYRARRQVQALERRPKLLAVERMGDQSLWISTHWELKQLVERLQQGTSVEMLGQARRIQEMVAELELRGQQLKMDV